MDWKRIVRQMICRHEFKLNKILSYNGQMTVLDSSYNVKLIYSTYTCKFICGNCGSVKNAHIKRLVRIEELKYKTILNIREDKMRSYVNKKLTSGIIRDCKFKK